MKLNAILLIFGFSSVALSVNGGHLGSPNKVTCSVKYFQSESPIKGMTNYEELLKGKTVVWVKEVNPECRKYNGEVTTCRATIENNKMGAEYSFNSQNGRMFIYDYETGLGADSTWMNQYEVVKSGYLTAFVNLISLKGGLLGQNKIFQVQFYCKATDNDWK